MKTRAASREAAQRRVDQLAEEIEEELDDAVFSDNGDSLEQIVGYYLQMRNATLAVAESCTGGLLAERITSVSGSSRYFLGGAVVYSDSLKTAFADVPAALIEKHGAVSSEVAVALAEGIRAIVNRNACAIAPPLTRSKLPSSDDIGVCSGATEKVTSEDGAKRTSKISVCAANRLSFRIEILNDSLATRSAAASVPIGHSPEDRVSRSLREIHPSQVLAPE